VNKLKGIAGVLCMLASTAAWADGEPTQEEFFESTSNRSRFEQLHKAGQIKGYHESLISGCDARKGGSHGRYTGVPAPGGRTATVVQSPSHPEGVFG
jgi:hypothetical protein